jgi:hypothetical protein
MHYAEQLTRINGRYYATLRRARRHPRINPTGASGIRRDRLEARAMRERKAALAKLFSPSYLR